MNIYCCSYFDYFAFLIYLFIYFHFHIKFICLLVVCCIFLVPFYFCLSINKPSSWLYNNCTGIKSIYAMSVKCLGLTLLLSIAVYQMIINDKLPVSDSMPLLGKQQFRKILILQFTRTETLL